MVVPHFCLQGTANLAGAPSSFYCLTNSIPTIDVSTLTLTLSPEDAAAIKLTSGLASSVSDSYLSFEFFTAQDIAGNQLAAITTASARPFDALVVDTVPPTLDSFTFDPSHPAHTLVTLVFSEPVRTDLLDTQRFVVQSRYASRDGARYALTGGTVISSSLYSVTVELLAADITAMKLIPGLIRTRESTYLLVEAGATTDLAGNPLVAYLDGAALKCLTFVRDSSPPAIVQSLFDLDAGRITFVFNEPVVRATVDVSALTIQLSATAGTPGLVSFGNTISKYTLSTMSYVSNANLLSETVVVNLAQTDQDELKNRFPLVSSLAYTWFSYTPLFVEDTVHNSITAVRASAPVQATGYVKDTTRPTVTRYALDMNSQLVTLTFSEGILASSVDLSQLNIQNIEARRFGAFAFLNESIFSVGAGSASNTLKVRIGDNTMAYMRENGIGLNAFQSFLCWTDNFVSDHSGNYLGPVWDGSVLRKELAHSSFIKFMCEGLQAVTEAVNLSSYLLHRLIAPCARRAGGRQERARPAALVPAPRAHQRDGPPLLRRAGAPGRRPASQGVLHLPHRRGQTHHVRYHADGAVSAPQHRRAAFFAVQKQPPPAGGAPGELLRGHWREHTGRRLPGQQGSGAEPVRLPQPDHRGRSAGLLPHAGGGGAGGFRREAQPVAADCGAQASPGGRTR